MSAPGRVVVVGAGLGGMRTVEQLRLLGYEGQISLVGAEPHLPYDRPPLSKQLLAGDWPAGRLALTTADTLAELGVSTHLGRRAVELRPGEVDLDDGSTLVADAIVLATGVVARRLPGQPDSVHTLRTLDDAVRLQQQLTDGGRLLVIGAGFVGAEVASTAVSRGMSVTVLEAAPVPLSRALGSEVGALCARLMREGGVDLRTGVALDRFVELPGGTAVDLVDGTRFEADVAVVGIGGRPDLEWMVEHGLDLSDGVLCDRVGRVLGLRGVWAVGDMSSWADADGRHHRHEHWTSCTEQAATVARALLNAEPMPPTLPYFWSDQFSVKVQLVGRPGGADEVIPLRGEGWSGGPLKGTVVGYVERGTLVAVAGFGAVRQVNRFRALISAQAPREDALALAASL